MTKIYTAFIALLCAGVLSAQTAVTFAVDLNNQTVPMEGAHIAGNFNADGANPDYPDWMPDAIALSDDDMDGIHTVTLNLQPGTYEFKYINGNGWDFAENVPGLCWAEGSQNRFVVVGADAVTVPTVCFGECAACGITSILFNVDMSTQPAISPNGVHLAQNITSATGITDPNEWITMADAGDGLWSTLVQFETNSVTLPIEFRYVNGNEISNPIESVTDEACGSAAGNRIISELTSATIATPPVCFNECGTCAQPQSVTIRVDMSLQTVSPNGVHVAGNFESGDTGQAVNPYPNWNPSGIALSDDDLDGVYEVTLDLVPANYEFKAVNGNSWDAPSDNEAVPSECNTNGNRGLTVEEGMDVEIAFCYNQCTESCVSDPDPAEITFQVDMSFTEASADGVWLIGNFTDPQWQDGATQLTLGSDNIYSATLTVSGSAEFQYKFVNGDVSDANNEEGEGIGAGECSVDNGIGGFNRVHVRSGQPETLEAACFDSCEACFINVEEEDGAAALLIYPNPAVDVLNVNMPFVGKSELFVFDATGRVVLQAQTGNEAIYQISTRDLTSGLYYLHVNAGDQVLKNTFVVR